MQEVPLDHPLIAELPTEDIKRTVWATITDSYGWLIQDPDQHPLVLDAHGVLRFKEDPLIAALARAHYEMDITVCVPPEHHVLNINALAFAVHRGKITQKQQRKVMKSIGYSLDGYSTLSFVQEENEKEPQRGEKRGRE